MPIAKYFMIFLPFVTSSSSPSPIMKYSPATTIAMIVRIIAAPSIVFTTVAIAASIVTSGRSPNGSNSGYRSI